MNNFVQMLDSDTPIIIDGGLATHLESMGFDLDNDLWSASLLTNNPGAIVEAHLAYLEAGADCIISASYQASRQGFMSRGMTAEEADRLTVSAVELAKTACEEYLAGHPEVDSPLLVAASVGPYGAAQHDGSEYTGAYNVSDKNLCDFHAQRLRLLDEAGADVLAVETIPNFCEAEILADLLADVATPSWVSFACRDESHLSDGSPLWAAAGLFAEHSRVAAVGVNCTPPQFVALLIEELKSAAPEKAIVVYPNSGEIFRSEDNSWSGGACDLDHNFNVSDWYAAGAKGIGGCCRTGPDDIAAIRVRLHG